MRFLIYGLLLLLVSCGEKKGTAFTVEGRVKNAGSSVVYLEQIPGGSEKPVVVDSARLGEDGRFSLKATNAEQSLYGIRLGRQDYPIALLINDSKQINVEIDPSATSSPYTVSGSEASERLLEFDSKLNEQFAIIYNEGRKLDSLNRIQVRDSNAKKAVDSAANLYFGNYQTAAETVKKYTADLIDKTNSPILVLYAYGAYQNRASQFGMKGFSRTELAALINKAASRFPDHKLLNEQKKKLPSTTAAEFSLPDTSGQNVALSSFRGKYVLVDFWASWCGPCRQENPNIVAAYNQFKDKNFTILGVSLDRSRDAWIKAIHDDGLTWNHVSDLKHWNSEAAALYNVTSIPYNVLVDPNGNIIAEDLRGADLHKTLQEVLK